MSCCNLWRYHCGKVKPFFAQSTPLADLLDVLVIIRTSLRGQAPQMVENVVTYPLTTTMLPVPRAKTVRGFSFHANAVAPRAG